MTFDGSQENIVSFQHHFNRAVRIIALTVFLAACSPLQTVSVNTAEVTSTQPAPLSTPSPEPPTVTPTATATPELPTTEPTATRALTETPEPTSTPAPEVGTLSPDGLQIWDGVVWCAATYVERIAAIPDAYVCLPEFCGNGALEVDQEEARKFVFSFFYYLSEWQTNKEVFEANGIQINTLEKFESTVMANGGFVPAGLYYPSGIGYRSDGAPAPIIVDYFSMDQKTQVPMKITEAIFDLMDVEKTSAARNSDVDYAFGKHQLIKTLNIGGGSPAVHFGMAEPVRRAGNSVPRFVLAASDDSTHVALHPSPGEGAEEWVANVDRYNNLLSFSLTLPGWAQRVTNDWGLSDRYVVQIIEGPNAIGVHLNRSGKLPVKTNVFIPSQGFGD